MTIQHVMQIARARKAIVRETRQDAKRLSFSGDDCNIRTQFMSSRVSWQKDMDAPSLTLTLQESQDILVPHGALHVTDDCPGRVVQELDTDLGNTSTRSCPAKDLYRVNTLVRCAENLQKRGEWDLDDTGELDGSFRGGILEQNVNMTPPCVGGTLTILLWSVDESCRCFVAAVGLKNKVCTKQGYNSN